MIKPQRPSGSGITLVRAAFLAALTSAALAAELPRALPAGGVPDDVRLQPLKDLDGYFPFSPPKTHEAWAWRAERVRRQIFVSQGLWPLPERTPLRPVVHGRVDRGEYTVEKVYFESAPGFFVTGNLYRPKGRSGRVPGVLFAHGHWANARLSESTDEELRNEIASGQERFEEGGRSRFQSLCVQLARMGCVVWQWDMLGNSDSQQLSMELVHRFAKQRREMNAAENWGLFSPQAETHLQSAMGLQTWNSIRSLDFLLSLPEVDPERVAMTGASGGGTQTMLLAAIDPRLTLAFPAVMVSTAMQGGCTCENACLLRVETGNVEFAALFAPKPQGMTTANDWTKEMAAKGFPEVREIYALLGAPGEVMLHRGEHFPHNYNAVSRSAFYGWLDRHFQLGFREPVIERDYRRLSREELSVWDAAHPAPPGGADFERRLLRWWHEDSEKQLREVERSGDEFRRVAGGALEVMIGRSLPEVGEVAWQPTAKVDRGRHTETVGLLANRTHGEQLPVLLLEPKQAKGRTVVWVDEAGKAGLFAGGDPARPRPEVERLLEAGATVAGVDLLGQGEFVPDGQPVRETRRVKNPREAAAYTFGYNPSLFAERVRDLLTLVAFLREGDRKGTTVSLVGLGGAGPWVAAARALARNAVDRAALETGGFRFGKVSEIHAVDFLPGGAKYGDLPGMLALHAPGELWVAGESPESAPALRALYRAQSAEGRLTLFQGAGDRARAAAVAWLLRAR
jgi:dienelactone hydrolase